MAISIRCSACGKRYQAADHMAGRRVRCKHCGVTFQLPTHPTSNEPFEAAAEADAPMGASDAGAGGALLDDTYATAHPHGPHAPHAAPAAEDAFGDSPPDVSSVEGSEDLESTFDEAFQEYRYARGNTPFVFPGSRWLDRWLPTILVVVCVAWLAYLAYTTAHGDPAWVPVVRLLILMGAYCGIVFPICLKGARKAARALNYDLPSGVRFRAFATFLLPVTIGCVVWLSAESVPGFIFGLAMGLIVALPVMWLLFRIRGDDAPTSMGYGAAALGISVLASVIVLAVLNLFVLLIVRTSQIEQSLAMSPFGPGFAWDVHAPGTTDALAGKAKATAKGATTPPTAPANEPVKLTTKAFADEPGEGTDVTQPATQPAPAVAQTQPAPAVAATKPVYSPIVANVTERLKGEMQSLVLPAVPGSAIVVVRKSDASAESEERIELLSTNDWTSQKTTRFASSSNAAEAYCVNADGTYLAHIAEFPYLSIQVYSFKAEQTLRPYIKLDSAAALPHLVGFSGNDQLVALYDNVAPAGYEAVDVARGRRGKRIDVPGLRADPGCYALSRDGKLLAVLIRDEDAPASAVFNRSGNGRIEIYNLATAKLARKIVIDELQWNADVKPAGVDFNHNGDRIAVLFEHKGQGLFICWGASNDIPLHQHLYPGGLVPEGVDTRAFRGRTFALIDEGRAFVLYGSNVYDTVSGRVLGRLGIKNVTSQYVLKPDALLLTQGDAASSAVLEVRLDINRARRDLASKE